MKEIFSPNAALHRDIDSREEHHFGIRGGDGKFTEHRMTWYGGRATVPDNIADFLVAEGHAMLSLGTADVKLAQTAEAESLLGDALSIGVIEKEGKNFKFDNKIIAAKRTDLIDVLMGNVDFATSVKQAIDAKTVQMEEEEARRQEGLGKTPNAES